MKYVAGIDIGTTNIKGSIYDSDGNFITFSQREYESYTPAENFHEQDPDDWVKGAIWVLESLLADFPQRESLEAISLSTQGGTMVPVDMDYKPLHRAITWLDRRGDEIFNTSEGLKAKNIYFYEKTGWKLDSGISFLPLLWLKSNKKDIFAKIHKIMFVNDYVQSKLCGKGFQDPSNASISLFYNVPGGTWDDDILDILKLDESYLSEVKNPGELVGYLDEGLKKRLRLRGQVKVINGSHDQYCGALSTGVLFSKDIMIAAGTAWVIFKAIDQPILDRRNFFALGRFSYREKAMGEKFGLLYSLPAAGASLKWFAKNVMNLKKEGELFSLLEKNSKKLSESKTQIIFYPYLAGSFDPGLDTPHKASFKNLGLGHDYLDMVKSIMEGVGFKLANILKLLYEKDVPVESVRMVGGGSKSKIWPQVLSDITGLKVMVPQNDLDLACEGAAIIAGYGCGIFSSMHEGFDKVRSDYRVYSPKAQNQKFYREKSSSFTDHPG